MNAEENADTQEQGVDNPHDKGYKRIFSIKRNFLDFIKKYVGFDWMMDLTENDMELIDKEFITDQFDTYESDMVYRVSMKEGSVYLFFLFELQSSNDFTMPFRLLVYMTAIWIDHFKNSDKNQRKQEGYRLPVIMPIVLHNGGKNWTASHRFREMLDHAELFGKYVVDFEYVLVSVKKISVSKIKDSNTLIDNIFLADKNRTKKEWMSSVADLAHRVREMDKSDQNEWVAWFSKAVRKLGKEERDRLIEQIREGEEKVMCSSFERILNNEKAEGKAEGRAEGKAEGRAEGRAEGKAESIIELLEEMGEPSESLRKHIMEQTDLEILRKWLKAAAGAETIADFEQAIGLVQVQCE